MSRRNRERRLANAAGRTGPTSIPDAPGVMRIDSPAQAAAMLGVGMGGIGLGGGYSMADWSAARGYIYWPTLDTSKQLTSFSRVEGIRRARALAANTGLGGRLLKGMARMAMGTGLIPDPVSLDVEWNKLMRARLKLRLGSDLAYDLAGRYDFFSGQSESKFCQYRDGDLGKAYVRDEDQNLRVAFFEGHQIGGIGYGTDNSTLPDGERILDGVRVNRHNRSLAFSVLDGENPGTAVEVPARDFALLINREGFGAPRGATILKHAANKMTDRGELEGMTSHGMKNSMRIGYALTRDVAAPAKPPGWSGSSGVNPVRKETVTRPDATATRIKVEDVMSPTGGEVAELPPGFDIKLLLDQRPHPNTVEFFDYIARDAAMGCDWPHELLYNIWKLGSANTRFVMADAQSIIEKEQQSWIDCTGLRDVVAFALEEIRLGNVRPCRDPDWLLKWNFITPARMTIDRGRDGKLKLEEIKSGCLSFKRFFGEQGLGLEQLDDWMDEVALVQQGCRDRNFDAATTQLVMDALYRKSGMAAVPTEDLPESEPKLAADLESQ